MQSLVVFMVIVLKGMRVLKKCFIKYSRKGQGAYFGFIWGGWKGKFLSQFFVFCKQLWLRKFLNFLLFSCEQLKQLLVVILSIFVDLWNRFNERGEGLGSFRDSGIWSLFILQIIIMLQRIICKLGISIFVGLFQGMERRVEDRIWVYNRDCELWGMVEMRVDDVRRGGVGGLYFYFDCEGRMMVWGSG